MTPPPTTSRRAPQPDADEAVAERERLEEQLRRLWAMSPSERVAAMRRGELNMRQCCAWSSRHPEQIPLLDGEFEFLAAYTPEAAAE
jgi:hypothetical protein